MYSLCWAQSLYAKFIAEGQVRCGDARTREAEAGRSEVWDPAGLHRAYLKQTNNKHTTTATNQSQVEHACLQPQHLGRPQLYTGLEEDSLFVTLSQKQQKKSKTS